MKSTLYDMVRGLNAIWAIERRAAGEATYPHDILVIELLQIKQLLKEEYRDDYQEVLDVYIRQLQERFLVI